jgi:AcrR family transcriptional regulator
MTVVDRRRERGRRNRTALRDAALHLFATTGFEATTVEQIAAHAGVAPRTFFHHFPSKEDVLFDGYAERLDEVTRRFRAGSARGSLWTGLTDVAAAVARSINDEPERFLERARLYDALPTLRARMLRINEEWIDEMTTEVARRLGTDPRRDAGARLAATLVNGANRVAIEVWVASGGHANLATLVADNMELLRPTITRIERNASATRNDRAG